MAAINTQGLVARNVLTEEEAGEARLLAGICNAHEGLDLKLGIGDPPPGTRDETNRFLYYEGGMLVGYCSLDYGELCGMVHPDHRRRGIGKALLAAALDEYKSRSLPDILIICEEASQSGKRFVASTGAQYDFSEHHMELETDGNWGESIRQEANLDSFKAGPGDVDMLAQLTALALDRPEEEARQHLAQDIKDPTQSFYIARFEQTPIATLKAFALDTKIGIYAFGVLPDYRGRGLGKQFLAGIIERLMSEGWTRFALEVETNNTNAIALYRSCGFKVTTTYGYYKLEL